MSHECTVERRPGPLSRIVSAQAAGPRGPLGRAMGGSGSPRPQWPTTARSTCWPPFPANTCSRSDSVPAGPSASSPPVGHGSPASTSRRRCSRRRHPPQPRRDRASTPAPAPHGAARDERGARPAADRLVPGRPGADPAQVLGLLDHSAAVTVPCGNRNAGLLRMRREHWSARNWVPAVSRSRAGVLLVGRGPASRRTGGHVAARAGRGGGDRSGQDRQAVRGGARCHGRAARRARTSLPARLSLLHSYASRSPGGPASSLVDPLGASA